MFGDVCPQEGKGSALVLPFCNTAGMNLHLDGISAMVSPGRHAVLLLDQAGWHLSGEVALPDNITCHHWNRLVDQPWRTMSIGLGDWTLRF